MQQPLFWLERQAGFMCKAFQLVHLFAVRRSAASTDQLSLHYCGVLWGCVVTSQCLRYLTQAIHLDGQAY